MNCVDGIFAPHYLFFGNALNMTNARRILLFFIVRSNVPLCICSQGSLATESAVLKLSGKVFDKPFTGPVS